MDPNRGDPMQRGMYADMEERDKRSKEEDRDYRIVRRTGNLYDEAMAENDFDARMACAWLANKLALMEEENR